MRFVIPRLRARRASCLVRRQHARREAGGAERPPEPVAQTGEVVPRLGGVQEFIHFTFQHRTAKSYGAILSTHFYCPGVRSVPAGHRAHTIDKHVIRNTLTGAGNGATGFGIRAISPVAQVAQTGIGLEQVRPFLRFGTESYVRNLMYAGPAYQALILCWRGG